MGKPTAEQIERGRRLLRRQGMADACVLLVARRFPNCTLERLGDELGITQTEMQDAVARFRARTRPGAPPATPRPLANGRGATAIVADHLRRVGTVRDSSGRLLGPLADLLGLKGPTVSTALRTLEQAGKVRREVNGRRTYLVEWTGGDG